jgi:DNA invertase Pin-like site-specific DNA recombinase
MKSSEPARLKVAYSYIRFSSPAQAKGDSHRRQTMLRDAYCERKGLLLDDSLHLRDLGVSAFRGTNAKFGALAGFIEACKIGRVRPGSTLIVENLDRLSRDDVHPALRMFLDILEAGVTIVTIEPEREYLPNSKDPMPLIEAILIFLRAHEESVTKSNRARQGWDKRRKNAKDKPMTAKCPAWLTLTTQGFVEVKQAADAVRRIFALCIEGVGVQRITKLLDKEGVPPFGRSGRWNMAYVRKILTFPAVSGEMQPHVLTDGKRVQSGEAISDYYPAVVSEEDFYQAQQMLKGRRKKGGRAGRSDANLFTGLVFHAADKTTMVLKRPTGGEQKYLYLSSSAYLHGKESVGSRSFPYLPFEAAVLDFLKELEPNDVTDPKDGAGLTAREEEIEKLDKKLAAIEFKLEQVNAKAAEVNDMEVYLDLIKRLGDDKKAMSHRLEQLRAEASVDRAEALVEMKSLVDMIAESEGQEKDTLRRRVKGRIRALVKEIWVLIKKCGARRVALVQIILQSGCVRTIRIVHPLPKPGEQWPRDLNDQAGTDLRNYPEEASANLGA